MKSLSKYLPNDSAKIIKLCLFIFFFYYFWSQTQPKSDFPVITTPEEAFNELIWEITVFG